MGKGVNLANSDNLVINLKKDTKRWESASSCLTKMGIKHKRFEGVEHKTGIIGCGLAHLEALEGITPRTAIFEDDIVATGNKFTTFYEVPNEVDAIYLGVSNHGSIRGNPYGHRGTVMASKYDGEFLQVYNMCSLHGVIYMSWEYIKACREKIKYCLENGIAFDLGVAQLHKDFTIITPNDPTVYQENQPEFTKLSLHV